MLRQPYVQIIIYNLDPTHLIIRPKNLSYGAAHPEISRGPMCFPFLKMLGGQASHQKFAGKKSLGVGPVIHLRGLSSDSDSILICLLQKQGAFT